MVTLSALIAVTIAFIVLFPEIENARIGKDGGPMQICEFTKNGFRCKAEQSGSGGNAVKPVTPSGPAKNDNGAESIDQAEPGTGQEVDDGEGADADGTDFDENDGGDSDSEK